MKPHKHAEVIHAFAEGAQVEVKLSGGGNWQFAAYPDFDPSLEYRIKPAAPKWPQTTMTYKQMEAAYLIAGDVSSWNSEAAIFLANAAIAHACESGALVPADKVREVCAEAHKQGYETCEKESKARDYERDLEVARAVDKWYCGMLPFKNQNSDSYLADIIKGLPK